jgi:mannose-1-phosphate guanylyltransferase
MRYAVILAGGSGRRLWPVSRNATPKQLVRFVRGQSLLSLSFNRIRDLVAPERLFLCAREADRALMLRELPDLEPQCYIGEPEARDTLAALGLASAIIFGMDPEAVVGVFTADHLIGDEERFRRIVETGFELVEESPESLLTFGIILRYAATGFGYLHLGGASVRGSRVVVRFKEKPDQRTAEEYFSAGPEEFLWNSGMFVWKAAAFLDCVGRYEPETSKEIRRVAETWSGQGFGAGAAGIYGGLRKTSADFAVMEPASRDPGVGVLSLLMDVPWMDRGSWPAYADTCLEDAEKSLVMDCSGSLVFSREPDHLVAALGCEDLLIIHTADATLMCRRDRAEDIKALYDLAEKRFGGEFS